MLIILSSRYERKKNIMLAVLALQDLLSRSSCIKGKASSILLVIAGGGFIFLPISALLLF